jgi:phospholipid/cholesterol/gamma-HCH transport system substrate-binding protein
VPAPAVPGSLTSPLELGTQATATSLEEMLWLR